MLFREIAIAGTACLPGRAEAQRLEMQTCVIGRDNAVSHDVVRHLVAALDLQMDGARLRSGLSSTPNSVTGSILTDMLPAYIAEMPPSTFSSIPVTSLLSSEARYSTA